MKRRLTRKVLSGLSFGAALFVFQACYGTPQDFENAVLIEGKVLSATTGDPIQGIQVSVADSWGLAFSDPDGYYCLWAEQAESLALRFEDVDSSANGHFLARDTVLQEAAQSIYLDITLDKVE